MDPATTAASGARSPASGSSARPSRPTGRRSGSASSSSKREKRRRARTRRLFAFDRGLGVRYVAGCDEAGRGSLAGPLVAAAVLLDVERIALADRRALGGLHDSKQMTAEEREELYPCVLRAATRVAVTVRCPRGIDSRGLHVTNIEALARSLERVAVDGAVCLVDGFRLPGCRVEHRQVVEGDGTSAAIAAASVVAKVTRDRYMHRAAAVYPDWGFDVNVGYSTPEHREAIRERGICALHRRSFQSIAYTQLELGGDADLSEGALDMLIVEDAAVAADHHPDRVEADFAEAG